MTAKQGPMYDSLAGLRNRIRPNARRESNYNGIKDPSPSPLDWKGDGEDHINIWRHAETELGRFLALDSELSVNHKYFGRFGSVETFWYYIQSRERDDRIRSMYGKTLKNFIRKLTREQVTNFRAMIGDTMYQRVLQYPPLLKALKDSTLPFDYYYIDNRNEVGIPIRPNFFKWVLSAMEEIRRAVKEEREPNFTLLMDNRKIGIYDTVLPKKTVKPEESLSTEDLQAEEVSVNSENEDFTFNTVNSTDVVVEHHPIVQDTENTPV